MQAVSWPVPLLEPTGCGDAAGSFEGLGLGFSVSSSGFSVSSSVK